MFYNLSPAELAFAGLGSIGLCLLILAFAYGKKLFGKFPGQPAVQAAGAARPLKAWPGQEEFPPLIDKPADHPVEQTRIFAPSEDELDFQVFGDEGPTTLLKEADLVVADIQDVVNHIASSPANPDEVCSKIRSIVSEYRIFLETEYYDAINSFIAVTVQRDCDLALTEEDLHSLWYSKAA